MRRIFYRSTCFCDEFVWGCDTVPSRIEMNNLCVCFFCVFSVINETLLETGFGKNGFFIFYSLLWFLYR